MGAAWKKGRGKLGFLQPLMGRWVAEADSEYGAIRCEREFSPGLRGAYVQLQARWQFGSAAAPAQQEAARSGQPPRVYEELALIGAGDDGQVRFWSFTSDGKRSEGTVADVTDLHPQAIGFEAQMPAGLARMAYWPDEEQGFVWVVESRTKKGWRRFVTHHYQPA
jgi:hypothetical protein